MAKIHGPVVINLDERKDRLSQIEVEFKRVGLPFIRMRASSHKNPALACIDSHCHVLENFLKTKDDILFVCEDDAKFNCDKETIELHIKDFVQSDAHVLCLGFYASNPIQISCLLYRSQDIQNRVAYIIKRQAVQTILTIWRGLYLLLITNEHLKNPQNWYYKAYNNLQIKNKASDIYRGDQAWKICQQSLIFVIPEKHLVVQRESYSDIEKRVVDYQN